MYESGRSSAAAPAHIIKAVIPSVTLDKGTPKEIQNQLKILSEIPTIFSGFPAFDMICGVTNPQGIFCLCSCPISP